MSKKSQIPPLPSLSFSLPLLCPKKKSWGMLSSSSMVDLRVLRVEGRHNRGGSSRADSLLAAEGSTTSSRRQPCARAGTLGHVLFPDPLDDYLSLAPRATRVSNPFFLCTVTWICHRAPIAMVVLSKQMSWPRRPSPPQPPLKCRRAPPRVAAARLCHPLAAIGAHKGSSLFQTSLPPPELPNNSIHPHITSTCRLLS